MITYYVAKADPISDVEVSDCTIRINQKLPSIYTYNFDLSTRYKKDAKAICKALKNLPQGTKHQLLILLLKEKEELYRGV